MNYISTFQAFLIFQRARFMKSICKWKRNHHKSLLAWIMYATRSLSRVNIALSSSSQKQKAYLDLETHWRQPKAHTRNTSKCISYDLKQVWVIILRVLLLLPSASKRKNIRPESQQNNDITFHFFSCEVWKWKFNIQYSSVDCLWLLHMASVYSYFLCAKKQRNKREKNRT